MIARATAPIIDMTTGQNAGNLTSVIVASTCRVSTPGTNVATTKIIRKNNLVNARAVTFKTTVHAVEAAAKVRATATAEVAATAATQAGVGARNLKVTITMP